MASAVVNERAYGGPEETRGMALLAARMLRVDGMALEEYLADVVFRDARVVTITPPPEQIEECARALEVFARALPVQAAAVAAL